MDKQRIQRVFDGDVRTAGGYLYTRNSNYSAGISTKRQTAEIIRLIRSNFPEKIRILDIGCGDGILTIDEAAGLIPATVTGFDPAGLAIGKARQSIPGKLSKFVSFEVGDVYSMSKKYRRHQYDLGILRGVIHHLDHPEAAIAEVSGILDAVLVLEPNGYNPVLKVIEKVSPYHRNHHERSYRLPVLHKWFLRYGFKVISSAYFGLVPYFCPAALARALKQIEPYAESVPWLPKFYCGVTLSLYRK